MKVSYIKKVIEGNDLKNIVQISTTSLIRIFGNRITPGSISIDETNEIFSYIDLSNGTKVMIDTSDINGIIGTPDLVLP